MLRSVEVKRVTDIPYLQGVQRQNKCLSRALDQYHWDPGVLLTGRRGERKAVVWEQCWLIQQQRHVHAENTWSGCHCLTSTAVSLIPLKYTLCRGLKINSGLKLYEDYTAAVSPTNAIKYLSSQIKLIATDLQKLLYHHSLKISDIHLPYSTKNMLSNCWNQVSFEYNKDEHSLTKRGWRFVNTLGNPHISRNVSQFQL